MKFTIQRNCVVATALLTFLMSGCTERMVPDSFAATGGSIEEIAGAANLGFDARDKFGEPEVIEELLYEIVEREPNGATIVQLELVDFHEETRSRTVVRDGETVEQVYFISTPVTEVVTVRVPAGRNILEYLDEQFEPLEEEPEMAAPPLPAPSAFPAPPAPVDDEVPFPPAPMVGPDA